MNSHVSTAELTRNEENLGDVGSPKKSCADEKQQAVRQPIIPPRSCSAIIICLSVYLISRVTHVHKY